MDITFIIPTIGRSTLVRTLLSLRDLKIQEWKAIVIFDGIEPTLTVHDKRITIISIPKTGKLNHAGHVRNHGIKLADTTWIGFVDDDDTLTPNYLNEFQDSVMTKNPDVILFRMKNPDGTILPPENINKIEFCKVGISFCLKRSIMINDNIWFGMSQFEDFELLLSMENNGKNIYISDKVCYIIRN
jgi:glycosyltransferase involved in cell wall biosynthesis